MNVADWTVHPAANLFPVLAGDELKQLADDIAEHGLHEPVWLWRDGEQVWLVDGRNRVAACEMAGRPVTHRWYEGDDPVGFVLSENVKRRHLTPGQLATTTIKAEELYERLAFEAEERRCAAIAEDNRLNPRGPGHPVCKPTTANRRSSVREPTTAAKAAAATRAKTRNVEKAKRIQAQAPDLFEQVDKGQIAVDRADRIIRNREADQRRVAQAKAEAAAAGIATTVDIRHGDFREVFADLTGRVDAVITDPPYSEEFLPLLADLAEWADRVLTADGVLAVLIGQTHLPEVYRLLGGGRPYRWTAAYVGSAGFSYQSHARRAKSNWKPLIVYGGGPWFVDVVRGEGSDGEAKNLHKWGQDYGAFHTIVERLTEFGQTVADPFMGSGTTLLAAHALGRNTVGCDIDAESVATARERLADERQDDA